MKEKTQDPSKEAMIAMMQGVADSIHTHIQREFTIGEKEFNDLLHSGPVSMREYLTRNENAQYLTPSPNPYNGNTTGGCGVPPKFNQSCYGQYEAGRCGGTSAANECSSPYGTSECDDGGKYSSWCSEAEKYWQECKCADPEPICGKTSWNTSQPSGICSRTLAPSDVDSSPDDEGLLGMLTDEMVDKRRTAIENFIGAVYSVDQIGGTSSMAARDDESIDVGDKDFIPNYALPRAGSCSTGTCKPQYTKYCQS